MSAEDYIHCHACGSVVHKSRLKPRPPLPRPAPVEIPFPPRLEEQEDGAERVTRVEMWLIFVTVVLVIMAALFGVKWWGPS